MKAIMFNLLEQAKSHGRLEEAGMVTRDRGNAV